jgi:hypothetical protein
MVVHAYNPNTWETVAGESQIQGQPGLHSETLTHKTKQKAKEHQCENSPSSP